MYNTVITVEVSLEHGEEPAKAVNRFLLLLGSLYEIEVIAAETNFRKNGAPLKTFHKMNIDKWTDN